jgi:hypothetical protein
MPTLKFTDETAQALKDAKNFSRLWRQGDETANRNAGLFADAYAAGVKACTNAQSAKDFKDAILKATNRSDDASNWIFWAWVRDQYERLTGEREFGSCTMVHNFKAHLKKHGYGGKFTANPTQAHRDDETYIFHPKNMAAFDEMLLAWVADGSNPTFFKRKPTTQTAAPEASKPSKDASKPDAVKADAVATVADADGKDAYMAAVDQLQAIEAAIASGKFDAVPDPIRMSMMESAQNIAANLAGVAL